MKRILFILLLFSFASSTVFAGGDTFRVTTANVGRMFGDNLPNWQFKVGNNKLYASPGYNDSLWQSLSSTKFNTKQMRELGVKPRDTIWLRTLIRIDRNLLYKALVMEFDGDGILAVYMDGHLINYIGDTIKPIGKRSVKLSKFPVYLPITDTLSHILAIRYANDNDAIDDWGFNFQISYAGDVWDGNKNKIIFSSVGILTIASLFATLFIVHLLLFLFYRKDLSNLYFAVFNISISILLFFIYYYINSDDSWFVDENMFACLIGGSLLAGCFSIVAFVNYLFGKRKIVAGIIMAICGLAFVLVLIDDNPDSDMGGIAMSIAALISFLYMIAMFIKAIVKKVPGSRIISFGFLFLSLLIVVLIGVVLFNQGSITLYNQYMGMSLMLLIIAAILSIPVSITSFLAWRFANINKNLNKQLVAVETLSREKQDILEKQNEILEQQVTERTQELQIEKQKSDDLLLNILPEEVAEELKENGESKAQYFDHVSVLFTDFVNFTAISERLGVEELLDELNVNFTAFDEIMERNGLEKIKTIGDAYLAVCGLPVANPKHAHNAVNAALEILNFVEERKANVTYGLDIRIGIHSGPLVAGIIGVKKFAYDIWGDTVNTAARMEQNSEAGRINISLATHELVRNEFDWAYRGKIKAKGKGEIDMYFVNGRL